MLQLLQDKSHYLIVTARTGHQTFAPVLNIFHPEIGERHPRLDNTKWRGRGYYFLVPQYTYELILYPRPVQSLVGRYTRVQYITQHITSKSWTNLTVQGLSITHLHWRHQLIVTKQLVVHLVVCSVQLTVCTVHCVMAVSLQFTVLLVLYLVEYVLCCGIGIFHSVSLVALCCVVQCSEI